MIIESEFFRQVVEDSFREHIGNSSGREESQISQRMKGAEALKNSQLRMLMHADGLSSAISKKVDFELLKNKTTKIQVIDFGAGPGTGAIAVLKSIFEQGGDEEYTIHYHGIEHNNFLQQRGEQFLSDLELPENIQLKIKFSYGETREVTKKRIPTIFIFSYIFQQDALLLSAVDFWAGIVKEYAGIGVFVQNGDAGGYWPRFKKNTFNWKWASCSVRVYLQSLEGEDFNSRRGRVKRVYYYVEDAYVKKRRAKRATGIRSSREKLRVSDFLEQMKKKPPKPVEDLLYIYRVSKSSFVVKNIVQGVINRSTEEEVFDIFTQKDKRYVLSNDVLQHFVENVFLEYGDCYLSGLIDLSEEGARILAKEPRYDLYLGGLQVLPESVAKIFGSARAYGMHLGGLKYLSAESAGYLSKMKGIAGEQENLDLSGLVHLSPQVAKKLTEWGGEILYLSGLEQLDLETASILKECKCDSLELNGLRSLSIEVAEILAQRSGALSLLGLKRVSEELATVLTQGNLACILIKVSGRRSFEAKAIFERWGEGGNHWLSSEPFEESNWGKE